MRNKTTASLAALALIGSSAIALENPKAKATKMNALSNREKTVQLLKSIETGDPAPVAYINPNKYIQHNLSAADGLAGFGALMAMLPKGSAKAKTARAFEDGEFTFTHTEYDFFGPKIGFDIFRWENGQIVEHWDNLQETVTKTPSGHTMIDGPTGITDKDKTAANKKLVANMVTDILMHGKVEMLKVYIDEKHYTQHNPHIADGLSGLGSALQAMAKQGITMKYDAVNKVLGEGNFVLTASTGTFAGNLTAFYDLFRVEHGKIVEHWDVMETIPPKGEWKNPNGKF